MVRINIDVMKSVDMQRKRAGGRLTLGYRRTQIDGIEEDKKKLTWLISLASNIMHSTPMYHQAARGNS
jgi:hypothetical protein